MKKVLKWIAIVLGVLIVIIVVAVLVVYRITTTKITKVYDIKSEMVAIPNDAASLDRGGHIVSYICSDCHADDLGGKTMISDPSIGVINTANLTAGKGGAGAEFTDEDWVRAIRHGVDDKGRALMVMPSKSFYYMSDADLGAVIAYLKSVPPVDKEWPDPKLAPMAVVLAGMGAFGDYLSAASIPHDAPRPAAPPPGVTAEYGAYLAEIADCHSCHGRNLKGGSSGEPGAPPAPDLTTSGSLGNWSQADFFKAIQTGVTPSGKVLDKAMPWKFYGKMSEDELSAIFTYLKTLH
jgi:mono/diheme cytochrome c family protein